MSATSSSTSSFSMKCCLTRPRLLLLLLASTLPRVIMLICQPVSSEARRTFWPLRPIAIARFSSSTTTSIACFSSSTTIDDTSAGASAPITNCAGSSRPQHDVDALAGELVGHGLHARAAHADAGADRVDALVVAICTAILARMPGSRARRLDLEQALLDLRHFELEQLHDEFAARCATGSAAGRAPGGRSSP